MLFKRDKNKDKSKNKNTTKNVKTDRDGFYIDKKDRHFRKRYTVVNGKIKEHPNYIVGETNDKYKSFGITHNDSKGKNHKNHLLSKNPEYGKTDPSHLRKQMEEASKRQYSQYMLKNFKMSKIDDQYVDSLIEKRKKKRSKTRDRTYTLKKVTHVKCLTVLLLTLQSI